MKLKSSNSALLATAFFALILPFYAVAEENKASATSKPTVKSPGPGLVKHDQENPTGPDNSAKNLIIPAQPEVSILRDSELKGSKSSLKMAEKPQKEDEKLQKKEEDPLSFNFLYYIIEKFKSSDIVE